MYNDGYMLSFPMEQTMTSWSQFKSGKWCGDGGLNSILLIYNGSSQKWAPTHLGSVGSKFPVATRTLNWPQDSVAISCVLLRIRDGHRPELEPKSRLDFGSWNSRPWNSHVLMFGCLDPWHTSATSSPQGACIDISTVPTCLCHFLVMQTHQGQSLIKPRSGMCWGATCSCHFWMTSIGKKCPMPLRSGPNWLRWGTFLGSGFSSEFSSGHAWFANYKPGFSSLFPSLLRIITSIKMQTECNPAVSIGSLCGLQYY